jgi:hypothetical protein
LLVSCGANPSQLDERNRRPVDSVALNGYIKVASAMIEAGAEPSKSCMKILRARGDDEAASTLEALVADVRLRRKTLVCLVMLKADEKIYASNLVRDLICDFVGV